jgi:hypothetical protein
MEAFVLVLRASSLNRALRKFGPDLLLVLLVKGTTGMRS